MFRRAWLAIVCLLIGACGSVGSGKPAVEFTRIPRASPGGRDTPLMTIEGRVRGARSGQQVVLFARSGAWWVQPFTDHPFTTIQPDSRWKNQTHPGTEYAALLVEPGYRPAPRLEDLPAEEGLVVAIAVTPGAPMFWQARWFRLSAVVVCVLAVFGLHRYRLHQLTSQLNVRFEERLAERTRIAQELHDTLLQGVLSASMQLHVAAGHIPADSPVKTRLDGVLELMGRVVEDGRNAVRGLRSADRSSGTLEQEFSRIYHELGEDESIDFRVIVDGAPRPIHPLIRDEVSRVGREALVNALRHARAKRLELEIEYAAGHLSVVVRDDGCGIDPTVLRTGREDHWGLSGMRERAERIGARLRVRSRASAGTEVELAVPAAVAYRDQTSRHPLRWIARLSPRAMATKGRERS